MKERDKQLPFAGALLGLLMLFPGIMVAQNPLYKEIGKANSSRLIHQIGVEVRPGYIFPTNDFLRGLNDKDKAINNSFSSHLRYSFQFHPQTLVGKIYSKPYQGIGLAYFSFGERTMLGSPVALYVFQGARLAQLAPRVSLNYEWNFGLAFGWKPYDIMNNSLNMVIGSKTNAYLNAGLHLKWMLSKYIDLTTGATLNHFSNGNTNFPNAGLNTLDFKVGLVYNFNREENQLSKLLYTPPVPTFHRHISYDIVLFGSWRRKGVQTGDQKVASPKKYGVAGFNFTPMYNFGYRFRAGLSLDGIYDRSANVYTEDYIVGTQQQFYTPSLSKQLALGVSGRAEYVMPYFTVGVGLGVNVLHRGGDFKVIYQTLSLKAEVTRNSFLHIGYCLNDFHDPSYLMLGIGYRFNNKTIQFHR